MIERIKIYLRDNLVIYSCLSRLRHLLIRYIKPGILHLIFLKKKPLSDSYGLDRGTPIDRYYIEKFISNNSDVIKGRCLELLGREYTVKFGKNKVIHTDVLDIDKTNGRATIIGDLRSLNNVEKETFDCLILTQVFQFIDDLDSAINECYRILKPSGVLLATMPSVSRIDCVSGLDGDYWRFTPASARYIFEKKFEKEKLFIKTYGNAVVNSLFLLGFCQEELNKEIFEKNDPNFPGIVCVRAQK